MAHLYVEKRATIGACREAKIVAKSVQRRVTFTQEEDERLREQARDRGVSEEELIRDAVRRTLGDEKGPAP